MYDNNIIMILAIDAQVKSPSEAVCPGNRISLFCCQTGAFSKWRLNLPSIKLRNTARSSQIGSALPFQSDLGFQFGLHIVSTASNSITSELQVTAVRELNNVRVECAGGSESFMSVIQVASCSR